VSIFPEVDVVNINRLSREARRAITDALAADGRDVGQSWVDFDTCCGIVERLKHANDTEELFPRGKWATIQHLQQLISDAVRPSPPPSPAQKGDEHE